MCTRGESKPKNPTLIAVARELSFRIVTEDVRLRVRKQIRPSEPSLVAVGTRISPRLPHRSRRALLTHRAPPSGQTSCDERFSHARRPTRSHHDVCL
jgi:hypothetical protein